MGAAEPKPKGRGNGQGAIAGHEKGQDAALDGLVESHGELTDRVAFAENEMDALTARVAALEGTAPEA